MATFGLFLVLLLWRGLHKFEAAADGHIETEKLGKVTFECRKGWSIYNANCYKAIDVPMTYAFASLTCLGQGSVLYYPENELEYHDFVAGLLPKTIWFGLHKDNEDGKWKIGEIEVPLENIPRWGPKQPDQSIGNATAVHPVTEIMIYDENENLPFVCKYRACIEGYIPCDLASKCIPSEQVCNGLPECTDERDENNCSDLGKWYLHLEEEAGSFQTGSVTDFTEKTWIFEADVGKRIRLYVPQMNLQTNVVFVEVWSGGPTFESSEMLHRFTGNNSFIYLYSTTNFLIVRLYAIDVSTNTASYSFGWSTNIAQIPMGEKVETAITTWKGIPIPFISEEVKPKNLMLWWRIDAPEGQLITYYVQIDPETGYSADDVNFDIKVYGMEDSLKCRYYYTWAFNEMHVVSNFVPENGAVTLRYKLGCGMDITDTYGIIVSPHPIPNSLKCSWTLNAGQNMSPSRGMVLKFYSLMLKEDTIGTNPGTKLEDKFMIYADGSATAITDVALYDGNLDNIIHAPGGHFKVDFESDAAIMSQGFIFGFGTDCEALDVSAETIKSTNMTYFWENVELSCPIGYKFHMEKYFDMEIVTLRCDSMWEIDGEDPGAIAECQVVHCGPPTKIQNGGVKSATGVTYSEVATYFCNDGFQMSIGGPNATCDKEGMWTNVPTCTSSVCSVFNENILPNGKFEIIRGNDFSGNTADFNTVVEFSCDPGYEIVGPTISFCDSDGWTHTDNPPICKRIPCPVPSIANSNIPLAGPTSPTLSGDTYLVSCNAGYKLRSTDAGSINMFCQANKTFDQTQGCYDIDECGTNTDLCQDSPTICMNTAGSYICECKPGYKRVNDFICTDIRECDDEYGGCSTTCVEEQGSYKCVCNPGFELFESDGFNSYKLPPGETGFRRGDRYFVNHTCVRVQCPTLPQVSNGKYLTNKDSNFHFEDTITLQCADGYQVNKTGILRITFFVSTCKNDGTWDELYSCEARKCSLPAAPAYGVYDKTEVMFGEAVTLTCNLTSTKTKELKAVCIYDEKNVRFAGADISKCPEIDCGEPNLVMPVGGKFFNNIGPATNTYLPSTSKFILDCDNGFDVTGFSNDDEGNMTVRCKENGRWNFGTLACADTENPTFSGSCGQTYNIDAVDQVFFKPGTASDNVAVASFSRTDPLQSGDRLLVDTSVTYTARDFQGNDETCTVTFNVIDRTVKPTLGCPHSKTIFVSDRDSEAYNTSSEILVSGGMLQVSPASLAVSVSKIGSADNVTATAEDQFGRESSCTFMVDYVANACFKEQIFVDNNAVRACNEVGGNLVCESTCKTGYIFSDKTSAKNFTCSGTGNWDYTSTLPHARFCLLKENPEYIVSVNLIHTYGYITGDCVAEYQTFLVANIPTFQNNIENLCNQKWDVSVNTVKTDGGFFEFITTLDLKLVSSVTVSESEDCIKQIKNTANNVFDGAMFCADAGQSYSLTVKEDSVISGSGERSCSFVGYRLDVDICLPYGPAQFFNVETVAINDCPDGQYQDGFAQTSCKSCSSGQYPNSDKTGCQVTCPRGFRSNSGFYPCTACSIDTYWTAKDTCTPCPGARSTVGIEGATDETKCIEPCPKGTYSKTGYNVNGCTSCPLNFYQDETTQRTCKRCFNNQRTSATGSISFSNCTDVTDVCDRTTCNDFGDCSYKRGYRECTCDLGNYDDRCQNMYHICDGNPCTYGATCVRGATPTDYTCTCRTDLDICKMDVQEDAKVGSQGLASQLTAFQVSNLQGCKSACLNNNECKEASFLSSSNFCVLFNAELLANELNDESNTDDQHLRKICNIDLDICEMDVQEDAKVGSQGLASQLRTVQVSNLQGCKSQCLNDNECKEASFLSSSNFCVLFNAELLANELDDESNTDDQHLRKICNIEDCPAGKERSVVTGECDMCERGYWRSLTFDDCQKCPENTTTYLNELAETEDDCEMALCPPGQYYITDTDTGVVSCSPCEIGKYNPYVMAESCEQCDSGKTTQATGRKYKSDCIEICPSGSGYDTDAGDCLNCPKGQYNDGLQPPPNTCKYCPDSTTTFTAGQSSCSTVVTPIPRRLVTIKKTVTFALSIDNCGSTDSLNLILTRISITIRLLFIRHRDEIYSASLSFCVGDCTNLVVRYPNSNPALACRLKGSGRRKRATTHEVDVELEFSNVSDSTLDTQNNVALSTKEVINQIINNNKEELSLEPGQIEYQSAAPSVVSVLCSPGEESINNECVVCSTGRYGTDGVSCELCPGDTYQDESGQSSCKNCPAKTFNDAEGATSSSQCKSWCVNNPGYCNNRGICSDTGRRTASCSCYDNYEGAQCASEKVYSIIYIAGAVSGMVFLVIIVVIAVCFYKRRQHVPRKPESSVSTANVNDDNEDGAHYVSLDDMRVSDTNDVHLKGPSLPRRQVVDDTPSYMVPISRDVNYDRISISDTNDVHLGRPSLSRGQVVGDTTSYLEPISRNINYDISDSGQDRSEAAGTVDAEHHEAGYHSLKAVRDKNALYSSLEVADKSTPRQIYENQERPKTNDGITQLRRSGYNYAERDYYNKMSLNIEQHQQQQAYERLRKDAQGDQHSYDHL
ncbi:uncharacterized protein LOC123562448 isoform X3 [Mercenaria mercenaria]|uniref:uncharacterized protein LOC123562448 isoform X3 n=1 Tax=Mercenaria mercenaria TaxID=6596 RepID=UPI00234F9780|nr:uncharacterized protein LOC123562448 isoform X3 [Mercenaria mercenaria]